MNAEVYQFYLRGRYFWNKRTADGIKKAIEQFHLAADRDPNYALSYVGLADCYALLKTIAGVQIVKELVDRYARREAIGWYVAGVCRTR